MTCAHSSPATSSSARTRPSRSRSGSRTPGCSTRSTRPATWRSARRSVAAARRRCSTFSPFSSPDHGRQSSRAKRSSTGGSPQTSRRSCSTRSTRSSRRSREATEGLRACLNAGNQRGTTVPRCVAAADGHRRVRGLLREGARRDRRAAGDDHRPLDPDRDAPQSSRATGSSGSARARRASWRRRSSPSSSAGPRAPSRSVEAELARRRESRRRGRCRSPRSTTAPGSRRGSRCSRSRRSPASDWLAMRRSPPRCALSGSRDDELDVGVNLLADIRAVFDASPTGSRSPTYELLDALLRSRRAPGGTGGQTRAPTSVKPSKAAPRKLARMLKPFGIRRADVWTPSGSTPQGLPARRLPRRLGALPALYTMGEKGEVGENPAPDAGSRLAHAKSEWARDAANEREGRGDLAQTERSRPPRPSHPSERASMPRGGSWFRPPSFHLRARTGPSVCRALVIPAPTVDKRIAGIIYVAVARRRRSRSASEPDAAKAAASSSFSSSARSASAGRVFRRRQRRYHHHGGGGGVHEP